MLVAMLRNLLLLAVAVDGSCAGVEISSLLQTQMRKQILQTNAKTSHVSAGELLVEVKDLAMRAKTNHQDPIRQCQGGWQSGDGTGGSERSIGTMEQDACVAAVRDQCQDANGATYKQGSRECFCEVGQAGLNSSAERVNCLFYQDGTTDSDIGAAVHSLTTLVDSIVSAMRQEHAEAGEVVAQSFATLDTALEHTNRHTASSVEGLQQERLQREGGSGECTAELDRWTQTHATACPAWELHVQSLAACSQASQCQSDTEAFFNAAHVWQGILANGGWEDIVRMREDCNEATTQLDHFNTLCPELEEQAVAAAAAHETALATHLEFCANYASTLEHYLAIVAQTTLSLEQRQGEYDILQQVGCYVDLVSSATGSGQLEDGQCAAASYEGRGAEEFIFEFPDLPPNPECLDPGIQQFVGLQNADFEDFSITDTRGYQYTTTLGGWQPHTRGIVVITTGNVAWGSTPGVSGDHFLGLQTTGVFIKQTVGGHIAGRTYNLVLHVARRRRAREDSLRHGLRVTANGVEIANWVITNTAFERRALTYTADSSNVEIELATNGDDGDQTVFLDALEISMA